MDATPVVKGKVDNRSGQGSPELSVVVPTFNESGNVKPLLNLLASALEGLRWEVIFVDDDSPDGTADLVREIAQQDPRVRIIRRIGRRGLTTACVEGVLSSSAKFFAVVDADMQHDESCLPSMLFRLKNDDLDIVVGSRYIDGGSVEGWDKRRQLISRVAGWAAQFVTKSELRDPMSGFFLMRRQAFDEAVGNMSQLGFKIVLDLFASAPRPLRFAETPYQFRTRLHGQSKLDGMAVWEYGMLLADKLFGHILPPRFIFFCIMGSIGLLVHMITLGMAFQAGVPFATAQAIAVLVAMTSNFVLNNLVTYRDRQLTGWGFVRGLLSFYLVCSLGAIANVGVAAFVYAGRPTWWLAGLIGALVGSVWNYAASAFLTWRRPG
jgi:dolichol-phosphate mannosyltransferase